MEIGITIEQFDELSGEVSALKALCVSLRDIIEGGLSSNNLHANAIQTNNIKNDAITSNKIIAGAITANHIQALAIDASKIAVGTITSSQIKDGTIAADDIQSGTITALQISTGTITAGLLKTGGQAFSHNMVFSSTDADTVSWTAGTLKTADGTSYSIDAGNTGNMTARTYIYLDKSVSVTVLQISTSYDAPLGDNRIPIATAQNGTGNAVFQVFAGGGGVFISGGMIAAHTIAALQITAGTITATELATNSVTAIKINVSNLQAVSATMGNLSAGTITGARINIGAATSQDLYFVDSGIRIYDGNGYIAIVSSTTGLQFIFASGLATINTTANTDLCLSNSGYDLTFYREGTLQYPLLTSEPAGAKGRFAYNSTDDRPVFHNASAFRYWTGTAGW